MALGSMTTLGHVDVWPSHLIGVLTTAANYVQICIIETWISHGSPERSAPRGGRLTGHEHGLYAARQKCMTFIGIIETAANSMLIIFCK